MKRVFLIMSMLFVCVVSAMAGDEVECGDANLYAYKFAGCKYIVMSFKDDEDDYRVVASPVIRMLLFDGTVMQLSGNEQSKDSRSHSIDWGFGFSSGSVNNVHYAIFPITDQQIEQFKKGVKKFAMNTVPRVYYEEFDKDEVGKGLVEAFGKLPEDF